MSRCCYVNSISDDLPFFKREITGCIFNCVLFFKKKNVAVNDPPITRKLCKPVLMIAG